MSQPPRSTVSSSGSYQGPELTAPELGRPITVEADLAYRRRESAYRQAERWNRILQDDPVAGPTTGLRVGVAPLVSTFADGPRWDLIWISAGPTPRTATVVSPADARIAAVAVPAQDLPVRALHDELGVHPLGLCPSRCFGLGLRVMQ